MKESKADSFPLYHIAYHVVSDNNGLVIYLYLQNILYWNSVNIIIFFVIWRKEGKTQHFLDTLYVSDIILGMFTYQTGYIVFILHVRKWNLTEKISELPSAVAHKGAKSQFWCFP